LRDNYENSYLFFYASITSSSFVFTSSDIRTFTILISFGITLSLSQKWWLLSPTQPSSSVVKSLAR
jgi:predicted signal transduction protein with EAL and GGDEF domain